MDGFTTVIQTNVVLAKAEKIFFQEVEFDFTDICPHGIFMVENVTENVEVQPYCTKGNAVMFNAWIYKNIAYKVYDKAFIDKAGNPTVVGELRHMTKVIEFGGCIEMPPFIGCKPCDKYVAEVIKAKVIGSNDQLLGPVEIYKPISPMPPMPVPPCQGGKKYLYGNGQLGVQGSVAQGPAIAQAPVAPQPCSFEPPIYQYKKLKEKMCIEIEVKVVTTKHLGVFATDLDNQQKECK